MNLKCLIVDDESIARKLLVDYVNKIPDLEVLAECSTALEAMKFLHNGQVDILLLDIQMPDITGLDFLKSITEKPITILTTAYSEYAVESYDLEVADYLLKPIDFDRFLRAINKVIRKFSKPPHQVPMEVDTVAPKNLFLKSNNKLIQVECDKIQVIKSMGAYVEIILTNGNKVISLQSMSKLEEALPSNFYRVHRSHILNIDLIKNIDGNQILLGNEKVILSKNKREEFLAIINKRNILGKNFGY